ncbi:hypothetical protein EIP91_000965 [Steccherinum ochraceum]|uniref:F-box domain-containing protein n=1 Tax=Steccherinum ochraceum TaxID=92696 RepID=A0A4R0RVJ4_9APHY|nr:hypothetical protein EIP91_000965 [Steccherinum ochraceum]
MVTRLTPRVMHRDIPLDSRPDTQARPHIPLELVDIILDYLHDDKPTLAACSLVSRDWRPSTRYHLFQALHIGGDAIVGGYDNFLRFLDASPSIRPYIRSLHVSGTWKSNIAKGERCLVGPYVLVSLLDTLTALTTLTLDGVVWAGAARRNLQGLWPVKWPPIPRKFDTLVLSRIESYDRGPSQYTKSVFQILHTFGSLQKLAITDIHFDAMSWNNIARLETPTSLALRTFSMLGVSTSQAFINGLRRTQSVQSLTSLDLQCNSISDAHSFGTLIRDAGANLESLDVDLSRLTRHVATSSVSDTMRSLNITYCTALTRLHLRVCIHPEWAAPADLRSGWSYVSSTLPSIPSSIQVVAITLSPPAEVHEDADEVGFDHFFRHLLKTNWDPIALALERCQGLKEVRFDLKSNATTKRQFKEVVIKNLPVMDALGVLQFA